MLTAVAVAAQLGISAVDRQLLKLAARAAGYHVNGWTGDKFYVTDLAVGKPFVWHPHSNDRDSRRLASRMRMRVTVDGAMHWTGIKWTRRRWPYDQLERHADHPDVAAATRRAVLLAAAEIGQGMVNSGNDEYPRR